MQTEKVLILARKHLGNNAVMESSARFCMAEAVARMNEDKPDLARSWAIRSLEYSVGIFHADYRSAKA